MATQDRASVAAAPPRTGPLREGATLSQREFHARYESLPKDVKYELIGGTVHMASPLRVDHGDYHFHLITVTGVYVASTPGVRGSDNATVILGDDSEPQPDVSLRILPEYGGNAVVSERRYISGGPEWLAEVSDTAEEFDLGAKRLDYRRYSVLEYVVVALMERRVRAFDLRANLELPLEADGVFRSPTFPGLWIDQQALLSLDLPGSLAVLQQGLAMPEHAAFVQQLARRRQS